MLRNARIVIMTVQSLQLKKRTLIFATSLNRLIDLRLQMVHE